MSEVKRWNCPNCGICGVLATDFDALAAENERLRAALSDLMPMLEDCDCIYSDRDKPLCPCRSARAALMAKGEK